MKKLILWIRNKYHPLFYLRKRVAFQALTRWLDIPVAIRVPQIRPRVYVSLMRNLSLVLSGGSAGEEQERQNFSRIVRLGQFKSFYDVGANIGLYGFLFAELIPGSSVHLFEPDSNNVRLIRKSLEKRKAENIQFLASAVSDVNGSLTFFKDDISGATGAIKRSENQDLFVTRHHKSVPKEVTVSSVTLDEYSGAYGDPDFIKIDVEGAESNVFRGAARLIERAHPAIFFECDDGESNLFRICSDYGYVLFDFVTLTRVDKLQHNNLALHRAKHHEILEQLSDAGAVARSAQA